MSQAPTEQLEHRLLIIAPIGKDAALVAAMLRNDDILCCACPDFDALERELARGVAAILIAEEALAGQHRRLADFIALQPPWSDLPVLLLTRPRADSAIVAQGIRMLGNVTLLERPVRVATLTTAVRSALRARARQYQTRTHIMEREHANRRKDEFLATLAHELRNPLAPIRNAVSLMRLAGPGEPKPQIWEMIDRQVNHMVRLVDDLMEVSRITRGKIELRKLVLELGAVIAGAVETNRPLIESANHALTVELPRDPLPVEGDAVRLAQIFSNLLNNAAKYTDPGGRIAIAARREEDAAVVTVSDNGVGISAAAMPHVFDMFVQADTRERSAQSGLGIGLTLVRSLVELHGGRVDVSSAGPGMGSEFVVRLPLSITSVAAERDASVSVQELSGSPRVLVVDDNKDAADSLGATLQVMGADVRVTHSGKAALEAVDEFRPVAIFLDLGMPGMDGYETARHIRARPATRETVLIALTGWGQEKDRCKTAAAGFNHHLVKPADMGTLQGLLAGIAA